jgi:hypothetical protein
MSATDTAISITDLIGRAASFGEGALPVATFIAGFFPGAAPVLQAITIALPIIKKIAIAAPVVAKAIEQGRPIINAIEAAGPGMLPNLKELLAIAMNHDPSIPETNLTAANISNEDVATFARQSFFARSFFTPQDERFKHGMEH